MTNETFVALVRKDWRVYRVAVLALVTLGVVPYVVSVASSRGARGDVLDGRFASSLNLAHTVGDAAFLGAGVTVLLATVFGGMAFAAERRDRSADFLALLPPGRWASVASKAGVAVSCVAVALAAHLAAVRWADGVFDRVAGTAGLPHAGFGVAACCTAVMGFGLAWGLSAVLNSPAVTATAAVAVMASTAVAFGEAGWLDGPPGGRVWNPVAVVTGAAAFAAGSVMFARRGTP